MTALYAIESERENPPPVFASLLFNRAIQEAVQTALLGIHCSGTWDSSKKILKNISSMKKGRISDKTAMQHEVYE